MRRVSVEVSVERAEEARAQMLELFPQGFEEVESSDGVELVAYTDAGGEERLWHAFGGARGQDVAADWRDRWKAFHRPVQIGSLWVGPPWDEPPDGLEPVVIDPGRAFGTGAHPTTQLCIELLLELGPASLVDFGCGSGVLSIVATKLGFAPVIALDTEETAIEATLANAAINGVVIDARRVDVLTDELPGADTALANITWAAVQTLASRLESRRLLTSGYLPTEPTSLPGFEHVRRITRAGWAADHYER
ncbi:MAG: ribosomal protein methyltransferase [Gaiellaceae bacterium]|nr:ribosomal protein methyltransferase [Gaiellaceae bacterium]